MPNTPDPVVRPARETTDRRPVRRQLGHALLADPLRLAVAPDRVAPDRRRDPNADDKARRAHTRSVFRKVLNGIRFLVRAGMRVSEEPRSAPDPEPSPLAAPEESSRAASDPSCTEPSKAASPERAEPAVVARVAETVALDKPSPVGAGQVTAAVPDVTAPKLAAVGAGSTTETGGDAAEGQTGSRWSRAAARLRGAFGFGSGGSDTADDTAGDAAPTARRGTRDAARARAARRRMHAMGGMQGGLRGAVGGMERAPERRREASMDAKARWKRLRALWRGAYRLRMLGLGTGFSSPQEREDQATDFRSRLRRAVDKIGDSKEETPSERAKRRWKWAYRRIRVGQAFKAEGERAAIRARAADLAATRHGNAGDETPVHVRPKKSFWAKVKDWSGIIVGSVAAVATLGVVGHHVGQQIAKGSDRFGEGIIQDSRRTNGRVEKRWWDIFSAHYMMMGGATTALASMSYRDEKTKLGKTTAVAEIAAGATMTVHAATTLSKSIMDESGNVGRREMEGMGAADATAGTVRSILGPVAGALATAEAFRDPDATKMDKARAVGDLAGGTGWALGRAATNASYLAHGRVNGVSSDIAAGAMMGVGAADAFAGGMELIGAAQMMRTAWKTGNKEMGAFAGLRTVLAGATGTRGIARGLRYLETGIDPIIETTAIQVGGGALAVKGTWGIVNAVTGARGARKRRDDVRARIARLEARRAMASLFRDESGVEEARSQLHVLNYMHDIFSREKRDHSFDVGRNAVDLAAGVSMAAAAGVGVAAGWGLAAAGWTLSAGKMATDYGIQQARDDKAERRKELLARKVLNKLSKGKIAFSDADAERLQQMRDIRELRAKYRRGVSLTWKEGWTFRRSINEEAGAGMRDERGLEVADTILGMLPSEREWILDLMGLTEVDLDDAREAVAEDEDPALALREEIAGMLGSL